uniref:Dual specificity protein phosphatase 1 n=1 Tax=Kalanchoe fedtschenkoi TaxID=63787 RepID=A0A7N0RCP9_KALFE
MMEAYENFEKRIVALARARNTFKCYKEDKIPDCIHEGLYLGSVGAATNKSLLKELNITHVLTVAYSVAPPYPEDFTYKVIEVVDKEDTNLEKYFDECIDFIDEAKRQGGGVLVHCIVGKSRSPTIVAAYLMKRHGMSSAEALLHVKNKRPLVNPNSGFVSQLHNLERSLELQATTAAAIVIKGGAEQQSN